ncbi:MULTISPECIES: fluoride efflux transporter FluC [Microbacterium]|uniref:fluoride efflux transporter FluC n=1 Tax=Microbacterium TaxID=33882 RepID=UPI000FEE9229|nr:MULTISPECIES: CrcB family protein [Microbacterium]RKE64483.1 camphor resistance protein CrcB [Microbacterium sp. AG238]WJM15916.1 CrcB family protein [Microbacterium arborescens]
MNGVSAGMLVGLIVAGGLGAGIRYVLDVVLMRGRRDAFPVGILVINVTGSGLLGLLTGLGTLVAPDWLAVLGIGLLGGYTTFSTVSVETIQLMRRGRRDWAVVNLVGTFAMAVIAAAIGIVIGGLLPG